MTLANYDYKIAAISPAQPGWRSAAMADPSSTASVSVFALEVAAWAIAAGGEGNEAWTEPVGLCAWEGSLLPLEAGSRDHLGYLPPGDGPERYLDDAKERVRLRRRRANRDQDRIGGLH